MTDVKNLRRRGEIRAAFFVSMGWRGLQLGQPVQL